MNDLSFLMAGLMADLMTGAESLGEPKHSRARAVWGRRLLVMSGNRSDEPLVAGATEAVYGTIAND